MIKLDVAKIFENGRSQAVRLPKQYRFNDSEVFIKKVGEIVVLIPKDSVWKSFEYGIKHFSEDFMETRDQPEPEKREEMK
jgi:antitoxin VapB|nr:type II toxin-antitoxin system VapB family antitoxin [Fervidicola ferrireducens]